jgi:hypothetical protein
MDSYDQPYQPPQLNHNFPHAMHFIDTMTGFDGLNPLKGLIVDQLQFRLSVNPVSILQIVVVGRVDHLLPVVATVPDQALGGILGATVPIIKGVVGPDGHGSQTVTNIVQNLTLTISIDLSSQDGLDAPLSNDDTGEVIDGQPAQGH